MNKEELTYLSRSYANMFGLPVRLYQKSKKIYSYSVTNLMADPIILCIDELFSKHDDVGYYIYDSVYYYGYVNYREFKFVIGPVTELNISENDIRTLGYKLDVKKSDMNEFIHQMHTISGMHLSTLIQIVVLLNYSVNKIKHELHDIRIKNDVQISISSEIKENEINGFAGSNYYVNSTRSYMLLNEIAQKIAKGDVDGLIEIHKKVSSLSGGNFASNLLRHHKNFFIKLVTLASRSAIMGGLDIDESFLAEEMYIKKCESLTDIDRVKNLEYHMLVDFTDRVKKIRNYNESDSKLVNDVAVYISSHITENIKTTDIASHLGKSRGRLTTQFKEQTGVNLSDFIRHKKIQKAVELIKCTNKSIVSISDYLGFTTQSHFCNVFKEINGVTPSEYRKKRFSVTNLNIM